MNLDMMQFESLPIGETANSTCPKCGKRKFYVTRKSAGLAFICFRASCGYKGFHGSQYAPAPVEIDYRVRKPYSRQYTGELFLPDVADCEYFEQRFGIDVYGDDGYSLKVAQDNRYAFPVWGPRDEYRGLILRRPIWAGDPKPPRTDFKDDACPKAISYFEENAKAFCGWAQSMNEHTVVIVEDPVSALRIAAEGFTALAIYGTHWKLEFVHDLNRFGAQRHILALDPDATHKALSIAAAWGPAIKNLEVAVLEKDPKDYGDSRRLLEDLRL